MTIAGRSEARFGDITKVRALGTRFYAMSGERNTVIVAANVANVATVVGETAALGSDARDIASNGNTQLYILTDLGLQVATLADQPVLGAKYPFTVGAGRWVLYSGGYVFAPAPGGLRVIDPAIGEVSQSTAYGVSDIALARLTSEGLIYGVDQKRAKIHVWRIIGARAKYISSFPAHNCRDVTQMVIDETAHILFIQCKHRIVGFTIPSSGAEDDSILVTLRQDYGKLAEEYTDFVKIGTDQYWVGVDADSPLNAGTSFLGRTYADWDVGNNVLFAAFPDMSIFAASDVIPYVGEVGPPGIIDVPVIVPPVTPPVIIVPPVIPPVIAPDPPVITSALTASVTEDTLFSYTITATGTGPIYYDVVGAPGWVTSINHTTGVVLGMPTDPGTVNLTITATNAGGSDTETLVVTVTPAINALISSMGVNGQVLASIVYNGVLYIAGDFTSVTDYAGTYTRNRFAAMDLATALWTAWNPNANSRGSALAFWSGHIYIGGDFTLVGGVSHEKIARVNPTTGAVDNTWTASADQAIFCMLASDRLYVGGGFSTINAVNRRAVAAFDSSGALDSWDVKNGANRWYSDGFGAECRSLQDAGSYVARSGQGRILNSASSGDVAFSCAFVSKADGGVLEQGNRYYGSGSAFCMSANFAIGGEATGAFVGAPLSGGPSYTRTRLAQMSSPSGAVTSWAPTVDTPGSSVTCILARGSSNYVGGNFTSVNATTKNRIALISGAGVLESFAASLSGGGVQCMVLYGDYLIAGGGFTAGLVNGVARNNLFVVHKDTGALL